MSVKVKLIEANNHLTSLEVGGIIDSTSSSVFEEEVNKYIPKKHVILDFKDVEYISSSGLRVLLQIKKKAGEGGSVKISNVNDSVAEVFSLTGFDTMLDVEKVNVDTFDTKAIFFDIDGTLLSQKTGTMPESAIEALKALRKNGIKIIIATGRNVEEMNMLPIHDVEYDGYLTLNGNVCLDNNQKIFAGNPIAMDEAQILVSIFNAKKIPLVIISEKGRYINFIDDVVVDTQMKTHGSIPKVGEYQGEKIYQCLVFGDSEMHAKLNQLLDKCKITSWHATGLDIISKDGGKANGIREWMEKENISRSQTMAFGDSQNDIDMVSFAGIGVAMGNGSDELKRIADYITTDIDDDGIKNALEHYKLI